jgi:hypothetical protein
MASQSSFSISSVSGRTAGASAYLEYLSVDGGVRVEAVRSLMTGYGFLVDTRVRFAADAAANVHW